MKFTLSWLKDYLDTSARSVFSPPPCGKVGKFASANFRVGDWLTHLSNHNRYLPHKAEKEEQI
jgi:hypothetical protein